MVTSTDNTVITGISDITPARMIAVWCPDWPVVAAQHRPGAVNSSGPAGNGRDEDIPVAVITANYVVACSHPARMAGVRRGMRRREAQSRCPDLVVLPRDEAGEARAFEPVVAAIESIAPGVEITRPGLAAIGAQGPTRYFGGETAVVHALSRRLVEVSRDSSIGDVLIGAADGSFAAEQAARRGVLVPAGHSAGFLSELPIDTIEAAELVDLLHRLGIRTLGAFADLPARDVLARFGPTGAWVHRQCGGRDARPIAARSPAIEHTVDIVFEPALDRVDAIAFSARTGAERFINGLVAYGLACTCLEVIAQTDNGEETVRSWRQNGVLNSVDVLDRIRWQLEGWLNGGTGRDLRSVGTPERPTAGVTLLRLVAVQCVPIGAHQQSLWSGGAAEDERAHRALARVQTLLGHGSVVTAILDGGREPAERTRLIPWGDEPVAQHGPQQPWPGHIPAPAPSVLIDPPRPVQVLDAVGRAVTITDRGAVPSPPARLGLGSEAPVAITAWAGPWPVDESWWKAALWKEALWKEALWKEALWKETAQKETAQKEAVQKEAVAPPLLRRARFQLVDVRGRAYLVTCSVPLPLYPTEPDLCLTDLEPRWTLDALYD